jgi:hypothetical protein
MDARRAEKKSEAARREQLWQDLQPAIESHQAAVAEYNRGMRVDNNMLKQLGELQHQIVVGYTGRMNTEVKGVDKKLANDVVCLIYNLEKLNMESLADRYSKLLSESEQLSQQIRGLNHISDLRRIVDLPAAWEYITNHFQALRLLLVQHWPNEGGFDRDKLIWSILFPDEEYISPEWRRPD